MRGGRGRIWTRQIAGIGAIAFACLVAPATAEDAEEGVPEVSQYAKRGAYLSIGARYDDLTDKGRIADTVESTLGVFGMASSEVVGTASADGRLGFRLHPRLAVESQLEWVNNFEIVSKTAAFGKLTSQQRLLVVTANAKYFLLMGRVQPYLTAGAGWGQATLNLPSTGPNGRLPDDVGSGLVTRFGAGIDLYGSRDVALTIDATYVLPSGPLSEMDYISIGAGLMLRFYSGS